MNSSVIKTIGELIYSEVIQDLDENEIIFANTDMADVKVQEFLDALEDEVYGKVLDKFNSISEDIKIDRWW